MNLKEMRSKIEKGCGKTTRYGACGTLWCGVSKVDELVWICSDCRLSLSTFNECMKAVKEMIENEINKKILFTRNKQVFTEAHRDKIDVEDYIELNRNRTINGLTFLKEDILSQLPEVKE